MKSATKHLLNASEICSIVMTSAFNPDRFDEESSRENSRVDSFAYQPFSSGPRVCIGRHFAMMEMTIILCSMLQRYKFRVDPHYKHKVATNLTMEPKGGLPVILERR